jgi:hypothetical protein
LHNFLHTYIQLKLGLFSLYFASKIFLNEGSFQTVGVGALTSKGTALCDSTDMQLHGSDSSFVFHPKSLAMEDDMKTCENPSFMAYFTRKYKE